MLNGRKGQLLRRPSGRDGETERGGKGGLRSRRGMS